MRKQKHGFYKYCVEAEAFNKAIEERNRYRAALTAIDSPHAVAGCGCWKIAKDALKEYQEGK